MSIAVGVPDQVGAVLAMLHDPAHEALQVVARGIRGCLVRRRDREDAPTLRRARP